MTLSQMGINGLKEYEEHKLLYKQSEEGRDEVRQDKSQEYQNKKAIDRVIYSPQMSEIVSGVFGLINANEANEIFSVAPLVVLTAY